MDLFKKIFSRAKRLASKRNTSVNTTNTAPQPVEVVTVGELFAFLLAASCLSVYKDQERAPVPTRLRTPSLPPPDNEPPSSSDNDVNRLSFVLKCINHDCGLNLIKEEQLLDYQNAHQLSTREQNAILKLAQAFFGHPDVVKRVVFLSSHNDLIPPGVDYVFYSSDEIPSALTEAAGNMEVYGFGYYARATKIMVCRPSFWHQFFVCPFRNANRTARNENTRIGSVSWSLDESKLVHCSHCKGAIEEACTCTQGCPVKDQNKCFVEHTGTVCGGCQTSEPIRGPRFECQTCQGFNLCRKCYYNDDDKHNHTHAFAYVHRVGWEPAILFPKSRAAGD